jgi:hypothetical protein
MTTPSQQLLPFSLPPVRVTVRLSRADVMLRRAMREARAFVLRCQQGSSIVALSSHPSLTYRALGVYRAMELGPRACGGTLGLLRSKAGDYRGTPHPPPPTR